MRKFLSQFLSSAEISEIEKKYKEKNADAKELPTYIPKQRFDEVNGKNKELENQIKDFEATKEKAIKEAIAPLEAKLKEIPENWKEQLEKLKTESTTMKTDYESKIAALNKEQETTVKIYEAGGRNHKAIKALMDLTKDPAEELARIKQSDPYLFGSNISKGTGKGDGEHGGDGDDGKGKSEQLSMAKMYEAVGLTPPTE